jgi:hypothetical protein
MDSMEAALLRREAKKRQDLLDAHKIRMDEADLETRRQDLQDRKESRDALRIDREATLAEKAKAAEDARYVKQAAGMKPGDVPTPDMMQRSLKTGNEDDFVNPPQEFVDEAGVKSQGVPAMSGVTQEMPTMQQLAANKIPVRFVGSPAQRDVADKERRTEEYIRSLPEGPLKDAALFRLRTGGAEPAGILKAPDKPAVGSFEDYLLQTYGARPTTQQIEAGRKKYQQSDDRPQQPQIVVVQTADGPMAYTKGGGAAPITGPEGKPIAPQVTGTTRTMMEGAQMLQPHVARVDTIAQELDKRGLFGVVMSRAREAATKVGTIDAGDFDKSSAQLQEFAAAFNAAVDADPRLSTDAMVGQFATELGLLASGAGRVHGGARGGGSIQMIDYMKSLLSQSSTYQMFHGRMTGLDSFIGDYAKGPGKHGGGGKTEDDAYAAYLARTGAKK